MKKNYQNPRTVNFTVEMRSNILDTSNLGGGGNTGSFDAKLQQHGSWQVLGEDAEW